MKAVTNDQQYFVQLDGLRFFAVITVMLGHWITVPSLDIVTNIFAACGVNLFFVLSGFLISLILIKSKLTDENLNRSHWFSIRQFYIRRSLRIFPIYYLVIIIAYLVDFKPSREIFIWLATYSTNIFWTMNGKLGAFGHLWSLGVEEQFYLCFPFFILFVPKRYFLNSFYLLIGLAVLMRLITYLVTINSLTHVGVYALMPNCLDSFCIGGLLAYLFLFNKGSLNSILRKNIFFIGSFSLFLFFCILKFNGAKGIIFTSMFYRLLFSICCFWVIGIAVTRGFKGIIKRVLENKVVIYLGKISYGLYLYHHFMPELTGFLFKKINFTLPYSNYYIIEKPLLFFFTTMLISMLSWHLIETPVNGLKKYFKYKEHSSGVN